MEATPPDYLDAAEPNWSMILPLSIDSSAGFKCPLANPYSTDKNSPFYKNMYEVYTNLDPVETAKIYTLTSIAIFDAIITCWE